MGANGDPVNCRFGSGGEADQEGEAHMASKLASRAAVAIINSVANPAMALRYAEVHDCTAARLAEVIDRETGLPEILAEFTEVVNVLENMNAGMKLRPVDIRAVAQHARAALARAEGRAGT